MGAVKNATVRQHQIATLLFSKLYHLLLPTLKMVAIYSTET
jgi:hypothetical protein